MIELLINHCPVELPADFSFSMQYENEFFNKASEYSLDIELPLKGSPTNQRIFGQLHRITTQKETATLPAEAYVNGRCVAYGEAVVTSVTDSTVKIQLIGSTSSFNYAGKDLYIDEMELGEARNDFIRTVGPYTYKEYDLTGTIRCYQPDFKQFFGSIDDADMVLFHSYWKNPNELKYDPLLAPKHHPNSPFPTFSAYDSSQSAVFFYDLYKGSCQPYLIKVISRVMAAMGYAVRRNDIAHCWLRNLYICNYRPNSVLDNWHSGTDAITTDMNKALVHWKVSTFIDEVEKFCACIFLFNSYNKTVDIVMLDKFYNDTTSLYTLSDIDIIDDFEVSFEEDSESKDMKTSSVSFAADYTDKYLKVSQEILDTIQNKLHFDNMTALSDSYNAMNTSERQKSLFVDEETGREYIFYQDPDDSKKYGLKEVNVFGDLVRKESSAVTELKIIPANTTLYNVGWWFDEEKGSPSEAIELNVPFTDGASEDPAYTKAQDIIENNYTKEKEEDSGCMEVMLSTGGLYHLATYSNQAYYYPASFTDFNMEGATKGKVEEMSLSLKPVCKQSLGMIYRNIPSYRSNRKFVVKFLDKRVPDQRQIFLIHNQRYVCNKLSADFDNRTRDFLIEGEFFRMD